MFLSLLLFFLISSVFAAGLKHESEQHDEVPSLFALKQNPAANEENTVEDDGQEPQDQLDLDDFSEDELIRLGEVLGDEFLEQLAVEPFVPVPSELVKERYSRPRREKSRRPVHGLPAELLQKLVKSRPITVAPEMDEGGPAYIAVKEIDPLALTVMEIDELELRSRIAKLSDLLRERALRGL